MADLDYPEVCLHRRGTGVVSPAVSDVGRVDVILGEENLPGCGAGLQPVTNKMPLGVYFEICSRALVVGDCFLVYRPVLHSCWTADAFTNVLQFNFS